MVSLSSTRRQLGFTQTQLALVLQLNKTTIAKLEAKGLYPLGKRPWLVYLLMAQRYEKKWPDVKRHLLDFCAADMHPKGWHEVVTAAQIQMSQEGIDVNQLSAWAIG